MTSFLRFDLKTLALAAAVCLPASARAEKGRSLPGPDPTERRDPAAISHFLGDLEEPRRASAGPIRPITAASGHLAAERAEPTSLRALNLTYLTGQRANDASFGGEAVANHISIRPALSGNGDFVAFTSLASNLVSGDTNGMGDVFRYQISTDTTLLASPGDDDGSSGIEQFADGLGRHWQIWQNSITDDGSLVCYTSDSTHATASGGGIADTNGLPDVFVRDMAGGTYTRISVDEFGIEYTDGRSIDGAIAGDGSAVAFASMNTFGNANDQNLLAYDDGSGFVYAVGGFDIWYKDLSSGLTPNGEQASPLTLVSAEGGTADTTTLNSSIVDPGGGLATRNGETLAQRPSISSDGRFVAYDSNNPRIADGVSMSVERHGVYVWDRDAALNANNTLVSINASGTANNAGGTSAVVSNVSSHTAHISPNGQFVAFTSTLDLLGGTTTAAVNQFVREVATPSSIRIANADSTGTRVSTGSTRGGSPTVDNNGDVTFTSFFDLAGSGDGNLLTDIYHKSFDSASGSTGPLIRVSRTPGGSENTKGITGYGDGFTQGAHDRAFHDPANSRFIFTHEAPELSSIGTFGLRTVFMADHDATPAITAISRVSKGDPSIDASVAMSDSVTSNTFTQRVSVSGNGQWLAAVLYPRNIFDGDFSFDEDFGPYPAVINLGSGQVVLAGRDASGSYMNTAGFSFFDPTLDGTFGDILFDDVYLRIRSHTLAAWSISVNNQGGFVYMTQNDFGDGFNNDEKIIWAPTATAPTQHLRSETNQSIVATTFFGSFGNPLRFTPNGRYIFFNSGDVGVATEFTNPPPPGNVEAAYRYDTMTDDIAHVSGRADGSQGGDVWMLDVADSGDRVLLFNDSTNLANDIATFGQQTTRLWIKDIGSNTLRLIDANAAGQASMTADTALPTHINANEVEMSGDGTKVVFESNADNLVAGVTGAGGTQIYLKNIAGTTGGSLSYADTGSVICLSVSNSDGMALDPGNSEFGKDPIVSSDGNVYAFISNASDLTGAGDADNNGDFFDAFYRAADTFGGQGGGTGNLLIASKNASDEQFSAPTLATVDRPNAWTNGNFAFVVMEADTANISEDLSGGPAAAGAASSTSSYWLASFTGGMTAADSSWELFQ